MSVATTGAVVHAPAMEQLYKDVLQRVRQLFETAGAKDPAHNVLHVEAVTNHVRQALTEEHLDAMQQAASILGALLHEADDSKLFPESDGSCNARKVLGELLPAALGAGALPGYGVDTASSLTDEVVEIIDRVSARKNKDAAAAEGKEWHLIVRDADRIEAVGEVGIARCFAYNTKVGAPLFVESTPRPTTEEEIWKIATPQRFAAYNGDSASMVDHYFDKLLHLQKCGSGNRYLEGQLKARLQVMLDFVLEFSKTGTVDVGALEVLQAKHCGSGKAPRGEKRRADAMPEPVMVGDHAGA